MTQVPAQDPAEDSEDRTHIDLKQDLGAVLTRYIEAFGDQGPVLLRRDLTEALMSADLRQPSGEGKSPAPRAALKAAPSKPPGPSLDAPGFGALLGKSRKMKAVYNLIAKVAPTTTTVLIQGESGTGKELVARSIHDNSPRRANVFIAENCAAIPETLLESELFGHSKGAFTGADRKRKGRFAAADGGTLFLDEVGDMSAGMQKKLLRALQEGEVRPVGSNTTIKVDVRFLSASNKDLAELMGRGLFREDLFYRLSPIRLYLPPLREREGDVVLLAKTFLRQMAADAGREPPEILPEVFEAFCRYRWPGNVRELQNELQRILAFSEPSKPVSLRDVSEEVRDA